MILKRMNVEVVATERDEIDRLKAEGFEPIFEEPEECCEEHVELGDMTVAELRKLAESKGIKVSRVLKKQDIIDLLEEGDDRSTEDETAGAVESTDRQE